MRCINISNIVKLNEKTENRIIIIGAAGHQGFEYYNILKGRFNIVAVVDSDKALLNERYKNENVLKCISAETVPVDFDIAIVCVPHTMHSKVAVPLLQAGKTVIKEKPLATSIEESDLYSDNMNLFTIVQRQFNPMFVLGREKMKEIGRIYNYNYTYSLPFSEITKGWRADFNISQGGVLLDMGYHVLDILLTYFGVPIAVEGFQSYCYPEMKIQHLEDSISILMLHENGVQGTNNINRHTTQKSEIFKILGENGSIRVEPKTLEMYNRKGDLKYSKKLSDDVNPKLDMLVEYIENIGNKEYLKKHLMHHKMMVDVITRIYSKARKIA